MKILMLTMMTLLSLSLFAQEKKIDPCIKDQNSEECKSHVKKLNVNNACADDIVKICFSKMADKVNPKNKNLLIDLDLCLNQNQEKLSDGCKKSREKNKGKALCSDACYKLPNNQQVDCLYTCQTGEKAPTP